MIASNLETKSMTSDTIAGRTTTKHQSKISAVTGSGKSNNSHPTIESAHQHFETIETKMDSIQTMLMTLMETYKPAAAQSKSDHNSLSNEDNNTLLQCTQQLSYYDTPKRTPTTKSKCHKPTYTPYSSLQYNENLFSTTAILALVSATTNNSTHLMTTTPPQFSSQHGNPSTNHYTSPSILLYLINPENTSTAGEDETTFWGDTIHCPPGKLHQVYFQNLNGLRNDSKEIDLHVETMLQYQVGNFCWTDPVLTSFNPLPAKSNLRFHTLKFWFLQPTTRSTPGLGH